VSNHIDNAPDAIRIYRDKDVVEKGFLRMKNCLDLGRLRVHSDINMQNKLFIGFVALIIMACIHKVMTDNRMYERMTLKKMLKTLERLRVQYINGKRIVYPLTSGQKDVFDAFGIPHPL
jgi:transposase